MTALEQLIDRQLRERTELENMQKQERAALAAKQTKERGTQGDTQELTRRQEQETQALRQKHSQQGQGLFDHHEKEHEDLRNIREINKQTENDKIVQERTALNIQRAEERERTKQAYEKSIQERESLLEKLNRKWENSKDIEKER